MRGDQAWHKRESSENELVGQSTRPALPFFVASNRCGLKYWSQRKERKFKANARTISRASGRKPRRPASWKGMRLVPPFVAFLLGAEGGYWLHPTFPAILMGTTGVVLRRISKLFSNPSLGFIGQASPPVQQHTHSLLSGPANESSLWREENGPVVPSELGIDPLSLADA